MSSDLRRRLAVLLTALAATLLSVFPAQAQSPDSTSPGERIAKALRTSPVYVDRAYESAVPPARQRQLASQIAKTHLPIKAVLTPLTKGDDFNGDSDTLASVVHDRLGLPGDVILITTDSDYTDSLNGYEWPSDTHQTFHAVAAVGFLDEMKDAGLADLTAKAVELVAEGHGDKVYEEATKDLGGGSGSSGGSGSANHPSHSSTSRLWPVVAVASAAAVLVGVFGALLVVRRRRRRPAPFAYPQAVFAAARAADESGLRRRAEAEVLALGESVQAADPSHTPGLPQALDAYAAAGTVLDAARGLPDLAGVLALVAEGRAALRSTTTPGAELPLCFFNPLHGQADRRLTWRPLGRRNSLRVAACTACCTAVRTRRAPEVLTDTAEDGRTVPYFEIPSERSVWAATGYGSLVREAEDGLPGRVARGDFTRSLKSP